MPSRGSWFAFPDPFVTIKGGNVLPSAETVNITLSVDPLEILFTCFRLRGAITHFFPCLPPSIWKPVSSQFKIRVGSSIKRAHPGCFETHRCSSWSQSTQCSGFTCLAPSLRPLAHRPPSSLACFFLNEEMKLCAKKNKNRKIKSVEHVLAS